MNAVEQAVIIHQGIHEAFIRRGGTEDQWSRVAANPQKFYHAWRRLLGIEGGDTPPSEGWQDIDPSTGEILRVEADHATQRAKPRQSSDRAKERLQHVACVDCANWREGCKAGFHPSLPAEPVHLCGRFVPAMHGKQ